MKSFDVATVGDNCIDRFAGAERMSLVGGNAVNVAVQLSRLGRKSAYFGAVGTDPDGARTIQLLEQNGVDVTFVRTMAGKTAYTEVERNSEGDRRFVFEEFGVMQNYQVDARERSALTVARHVHIGWLNDGGTLRTSLSRQGISVSQDLSVNAEPGNLGVAGLDIAFASSDGGDDDVRRLAESVLRGGAKVSVVTRGSKGSFATNGEHAAALNAARIQPVDTTGAGDAFIAGFIDAWLNRAALERCLEKGRDSATASCLHLGGFPQTAVPY